MDTLKSTESKIAIAQIEDAIVRILQKTMGMDPEALRAGARFESIDDSFDSLSFTELMIGLEEELEVEFDQASMPSGQKAPGCLRDLAEQIQVALVPVA